MEKIFLYIQTKSARYDRVILIKKTRRCIYISFATMSGGRRMKQQTERINNKDIISIRRLY